MDVTAKSSELRLKIEALMVKYPNRSFCEHDIASMLDIDDEAPKIRSALANLRTYFFIENTAADTCSAREVPHSKYRATDKLQKKHSDMPEEEMERTGKRKYKKRAKTAATGGSANASARSLGELLSEVEADVAEIRKRLEALR